MWDEIQGNWEQFALESQATVDAALGNRQLMVEQPLTEYTLDIGDEPNYSAENKSSYTQIRVGQKFFRQSVISAYQGRCCITGLSESRLLIASHIIPWRRDKHNRLNPRNGLCLSALHDKAFDQGLFTLTNNFQIELSQKAKAMAHNRFAAEWLVDLNGRSIELPEKFQPSEEFIDWHRKNIFIDK